MRQDSNTPRKNTINPTRATFSSAHHDRTAAHTRRAPGRPFGVCRSVSRGQQFDVIGQLAILPSALKSAPPPSLQTVVHESLWRSVFPSMIVGSLRRKPCRKSCLHAQLVIIYELPHGTTIKRKAPIIYFVGQLFKRHMPLCEDINVTRYHVP